MSTKKRNSKRQARDSSVSEAAVQIAWPSPGTGASGPPPPSSSRSPLAGRAVSPQTRRRRDLGPQPLLLQRSDDQAGRVARATLAPARLTALSLRVGDPVVLVDAASDSTALAAAWPASDVAPDIVSVDTVTASGLPDLCSSEPQRVYLVPLALVLARELGEESEDAGFADALERACRLLAFPASAAGQGVVPAEVLRISVDDTSVGSSPIDASLLHLPVGAVVRPGSLVPVLYLGRVMPGLVAGSTDIGVVPADAWILRVSSRTTVSWSVGTVLSPPPPQQQQQQQQQSAATPWQAIPPVLGTALGGLDSVVADVGDVLDLALTHRAWYQDLGVAVPRGVLLHGAPGVGKSLLALTAAHRLRTACPSAWCVVVSARDLRSEQQVRELFVAAQDACGADGSAIIVLDDVHALDAGTAADAADRSVVMAAALSRELDRDPWPRLVVLATTDAIVDVPVFLRRPGRFAKEIEVPTPAEPQRAAILSSLLCGVAHTVTRDCLAGVAGATHGYTGADLAALMQRAAEACLQRRRENPSAALSVGAEDLRAAMRFVRPSALRSVMLEVPKVHWDDVGGQEEVKTALREAVEWPIKRAATLQRLGITAPRGILLYGPPGCSKTLMAKAVATETGLNFLAVKGPELFSKWVGDSERAVRDVFAKARAAAPAVVFFDEIDALASRRNSGGGGGGVGVSERVLTTLLNELDGIEAMAGVVVLAATNRPDLIDAALTRPGRLDRLLYVAPPDKASRETVLAIHLRGTPFEPGMDKHELIVSVAARTDGYSGAELASVCRRAALAAMHEDQDASWVAARHFDRALVEVKPRITREMLMFFTTFRDTGKVFGVPSNM